MGDLTLKVSKDLAPIPYQRQPSLDTLLSKLLLGIPCPWDITEDDVGDILILIAAWGACPS